MNTYFTRVPHPNCPTANRRLHLAPTGLVILCLGVLASPELGASTATCPLYPIGLHTETIEQATPGDVLPDVFNGQGPGQFGWLSWSGSPSTPTLLHSLTPPGNSLDYVNPDDPQDRSLDPDDWVSGKPGLSNSKKIRSALDHLLNLEITVPVWDATRDRGEKAAYRIVAFARIQLVDYDLPGQNRIRARFLGAAPCGKVNSPPQVNAGPDLNLSLGAIAQLFGTVTDDGLPSPNLAVQWSQVSGPDTVMFTQPGQIETRATFPTPGIFEIRLSAADGEFTVTDSLRITVDQPNRVPVADPQSLELFEDISIDIELTGTDPDLTHLSYRIDLAPSHGQLSGTPPLLLYTPDPDYNGADSFTFSVSDGELASIPARVDLTLHAVNDPPVADSLTIQTYEDQSLTLQLSGADVEGATLQFDITQVPAHAGLQSDPDRPGRVDYCPAPDFHGTDQFEFRVSDGNLWSESAAVQIEVLPVNDSPFVEAGPDLATMVQTPFSLSGTIRDDDSAQPESLAAVWTKVTGPGVIHFDDPLTPSTTARASDPGVYTLQLSATDSLETSSDTLAVLVQASTANQPPVVHAGPDQTLGGSRQTFVAGHASDDNFLGTGHLQLYWTQSSGPGIAAFVEPTTTNTRVHFSEDGVHVLTLAAEDGELSASDTVTITVHANNLPPQANAGPDHTLAWLDDESTLTRTDRPRGGRIVVSNDEWMLSDVGLYNAPTAGNFALNVANWFTGGRPGSFLGYSRDFGITGASLAATLRAAGHSWTVNPYIPCTLENLLTFDAVWIVNLDIDLEALAQYVQAGGCVYLASGTLGALPGGEVPFWNSFLREFGLEFDSAYHGVAGSLPVSGNHPLLHNVDSLYIYNGNYVRELHPTNPATRIIAGNPNAGLIGVVDPNLQPLLLQGLGLDDGQPEGSSLSLHWQQIEGPAPAVLSSPHDAATTVAFPAPGTYVFRLTVSDSTLEAHDDVTVTLTENPAPSVDAGPDQSLTLPETLQCQGHVADSTASSSDLQVNWELISGPGAVTFDTPSNPHTIVRFSEPGRYLLQLNAANPSFRSSDQIAVDVFLPSAPLGHSRDLWLAFDHSLTDQTGSLSAEPAGTLSFIPGFSGEALAFDGATTRLRIPNSPFSNPAQPLRGLTFEAWISPSGDLSPRPLLVWAEPYSQGTLEWWLSQPAPGGLRATFIDNSGIPRTVATPNTRHPADPLSVQLGRFQHVALTYEVKSGVATLYLNATPVAQADLGSFQPQTHANLWVGYHPGNGIRYRGLLDEIAVHPRALHVDEIARITHAGPNGGIKSLWVDAGPDVAVEVGQTLNLHASLAGGTVPHGEIPVIQWRILQTAGVGAFSDANARETQVEFDTPGIYVLQITAETSTETTGDSLTVNVIPTGSLNQAPLVDAGPDATVLLHSAWTPQAHVTDDRLPTHETLRLAWQTIAAPGAVRFDHPDTLHPQVWFGTPGSHTLRLVADDSLLSSSDEITVVVRENLPPIVNAGSDITTPSPTVVLTGSVADDDLPTGSLLTVWSMIRGPAPVNLESPQDVSSPVTFTSSGAYLFELGADDGQLHSSDHVVVEYRPDANQAPKVDAGPDQVVALEKPTTLNAQTTDDGLPTGTLKTAWRQTSGPGRATVTRLNGMDQVSFDLEGTYTLEFHADDGDLQATDAKTLTVIATPEPPTVTLHESSEAVDITAPAPIIGSVSSPILQAWQLEVRTLSATPDAPWQSLASGFLPVAREPLGTFDPTTLPNGLYQLRAQAVDQLGQIATTEPLAVTVRGALKPGRFHVNFKDLALPLPGIPITLIRSYDSFDAQSGQQGDFGAGWSLELQSLNLQKSEPLDRDWEALHSGAWYALAPARPKLITITLPSEQVLQFAPVLSPSLQFGVPIASVSLAFTNLSGTSHTLAVDGPNQAAIDGYLGQVNLIDPAGFAPFDPSRFRLTTGDGTSYLLDEHFGLREIADLFGNTLVITSDAVLHSSGWAVHISRDHLSRITRITDPSGRHLDYTYDEAGNLSDFKNPESLHHRFSYDDQHRLLTILNNEGVIAVENTFAADGRLIQQTDALGQSIAFTHDINNRQDIVADRLGHLTTHYYDDRGNVIRTIDPLGAVTDYAYDDHDNLVESVDPLGHRITHDYDEHNNLLSTTDALGHVTRYAYDSRDRLTRITDPLGRTHDFAYDAHGNLLTEITPDGAATAYNYDPQGLLQTTTDPLGQVTHFEYDENGLLTHITDALGHPTTFVYDSSGNILEQHTSRTRPDQSVESLVTRYDYDPLNRIIATTAPDNSITRVAYHPLGHPAVITDPLNRSNTLDYDPLGRPIRITFPDGSTQGVAYDAEGRRTALTNELGQVTRFSLDPLGRITAVEYPDSTRVTRAYDLAGRCVAVTDARGHTTSFGYDPRGQILSVTNALGHVTHYEHDNAGQLVAVTDSLGHTTRYRHDLAGRVTRTIRADGSAESTLYNETGLPTQHTDAAGLTTAYAYDSLGHLTSISDPLGHVTRYHYNESGALTARTDANGHTTLYERDPLNRLTRRILPSGDAESLHYDPAGRLILHTDFNGDSTTFEYDERDRLVARYPDPRWNEPPALFTYNAAGQRTAMDDSLGRSTYDYDLHGRLTAITRHNQLPAMPTAWTVGVAYAYDLAGNLHTTRSGQINGAEIHYSHDPLNRLTSVRDTRLGETRYAYDPAGNLTGTTLPNGIRVSRQYDALNRLTNTITAQPEKLIAQYDCTLAPTGHRLTADENLLTDTGWRQLLHNYTYDRAWRLIRETIQAPSRAPVTLNYTYDPVGNRLSRLTSAGELPDTVDAYTVNDELTSDTYDFNGNTRTGESTFGELLTCTYNSRNQLVQAILPDGTRVDFSYDGDGQRWARTLTVPGQPSVTTWTIPTPINPTGWTQALEELQSLDPSDPLPTVTRTYTWGHQLLAQDQLLDGSWTAHWFGHDGHRSIRFLHNPTGQVTDSYDYDAFGNLLASVGDTPNLYGFAGETFDPDLGFYHLRARYLNPNTGRFWTRDPFPGLHGSPSTQHPYLYCGADPVNAWDPSGYLTLTEAQVTTTITSIIHAMAIYHGTDTLLRGQEELSNIGLAGPELYEAIEIVLIYQLVSDSAAIFNIGRSVPAASRFLLAKAGWAFNRLSRLSPRQWLNLKLSSPKPLIRPITQAELAVRSGEANSRGVYFFGEDVFPYLNRATATLGQRGRAHFYASLDDMATVTTAGQAARLSGQAPSITRAYVTGTPAYGVAFPTQGLGARLPSIGDARGNPNFFPGGRTAVALPGQEGGYLLNTTREFVTDGGRAMPSGSVLFEILADGTWMPIRRF